eukprot:TRINITY_DN36684_c0_g1_i1.p1 TRINITY_DN36684_c0_g1~~TRINITY_DN36684_c0_g1_i1.p1  ORF type:complete len:192 (+),score=24.69 TRINITY_DN36684_c0_g1_i1:43-576(+)
MVSDAARTILLRQTSGAFLALWSLFLWWLFVMLTHSAWSCGDCVAKSLGVSAIVGLGLNANGYAASNANSVAEYVKNGPFSVARFFLIPFCVASYSAIANVKKDMFTYLFPKDGPEPMTYSGIGVICLASLVGCALLFRHVVLLPEDVNDAKASSSSNTSLDEGIKPADHHYVSMAK